jgi:hypothetical protein
MLGIVLFECIKPNVTFNLLLLFSVCLLPALHPQLECMDEMQGLQGQTRAQRQGEFKDN